MSRCIRSQCLVQPVTRRSPARICSSGTAPCTCHQPSLAKNVVKPSPEKTASRSTKWPDTQLPYRAPQPSAMTVAISFQRKSRLAKHMLVVRGDGRPSKCCRTDTQLGCAGSSAALHATSPSAPSTASKEHMKKKHGGSQLLDREPARPRAALWASLWWCWTKESLATRTFCPASSVT